MYQRDSSQEQTTRGHVESAERREEKGDDGRAGGRLWRQERLDYKLSAQYQRRMRAVETINEWNQGGDGA